MVTFCGMCGSSLDPATGLCPNCNAGQVHMEPMNADDQAAADAQEAVASATSGVESDPDTPRSRKRTGRVVAVVGGLVLLAVLGVFIGMQTGVLALTTESKISRQLSLGQKYLLEEDYEQAVIAFNKVIELDASRLEAYQGLVNTYTASGDYAAAIETWQEGEPYTQERTAEEQDAYDGCLAAVAAAVRDYTIGSDSDAQDKLIWCQELLTCNTDLIAAYEGQIDAYLYQDDVDHAYSSYQKAQEVDGLTDAEIGSELEPYRTRLRDALQGLLDQTSDLDQRIHLLQMLAALYLSNSAYKNELNTLLAEREHQQTIETFLRKNKDSLDYLLAQCETGDDETILALYSSPAYGAVYQSFPEGESQIALEQNGTTLVLVRLKDVYKEGLYIYYGEVRDGVLSGEGSMYDRWTEDGDYATYKGHWENNMPNGTGTCHNHVRVDLTNYGMGWSWADDITTGTYANGLENGDMTYTDTQDFISGTITWHYTARNGVIVDNAVVYSDEVSSNGKRWQLEVNSELGFNPYYGIGVYGAHT